MKLANGVTSAHASDQTSHIDPELHDSGHTDSCPLPTDGVSDLTPLYVQLRPARKSLIAVVAVGPDRAA